MNAIAIYGDELLAECNGVRHGFFGRTGGVSSGVYESLNCGPGSGDESSNVDENRRRALNALGAEILFTNYQVHGGEVRIVAANSSEHDRAKADGMATATPGMAIGILSADCAPVLLADPKAGVIGAAHAGWRGALAGITDATLQAMESLGAHRIDIRAVIGPAIAQDSYEVGNDVREAFLAEAPENLIHFAPGARDGHYQFDLPGYVTHRITNAGIGAVESIGLDTYELAEEFFSYRRNCHHGHNDYGRQLSAILLSG